MIRYKDDGSVDRDSRAKNENGIPLAWYWDVGWAELADAIDAANAELKRQNEANDMIAAERDAYQAALAEARRENERILMERRSAYFEYMEEIAKLSLMVSRLLAHCQIDECETCGAIVCPLGSPDHFWKDGCPQCWGKEQRDRAALAATEGKET